MERCGSNYPSIYVKYIYIYIYDYNKLYNRCLKYVNFESHSVYQETSISDNLSKYSEFFLFDVFLYLKYLCF